MPESLNSAPAHDLVASPAPLQILILRKGEERLAPTRMIADAEMVLLEDGDITGMLVLKYRYGPAGGRAQIMRPSPTGGRAARVGG